MNENPIEERYHECVKKFNRAVFLMGKITVAKKAIKLYTQKHSSEHIITKKKSHMAMIEKNMNILSESRKALNDYLDEIHR